MSEAEQYEPRDRAPVIDLDAPPSDLGVDSGQLAAWSGGSGRYLPSHRVPPSNDPDGKEEGRLWVLRDDVLAVMSGAELNPPAEVHDDLRRVYVIALPDCDKAAHEGQDCVYVGQSWYPARARFIQHLLGYKSSRHVRKWGTRLLPDLYADLPACRTSTESEELETKRALDLRDEGYTVHGVTLP